MLSAMQLFVKLISNTSTCLFLPPHTSAVFFTTEVISYHNHKYNGVMMCKKLIVNSIDTIGFLGTIKFI